MLQNINHCTGFYFRYFSPDDDGVRIESEPNTDTLRATETILKRTANLLAERPDLMEKLCCLENGVEVRLYQGKGFNDEESEVYLFGRTTVHGDDAILEFAVDEVLHGGQGEHDDVMDVVVHELIHLIDYLDDEDGILPGWTDEQIETYMTARETEIKKMKAGQPSPMVEYALTNDVEFLAVLAEVYAVKPSALKKTNKALFTLLNNFFHPAA